VLLLPANPGSVVEILTAFSIPDIAYG